MTALDLEAAPRTIRLTRLVRDWWPVPLVIATALVAQEVLLSSRYDVGGHAAEHLASATVPFMAAAVVFIILWATPPARRQIDVLLAAAGWFATTLLVMLGNLRVIDDLVAAGHSHTPTSAIPDVADHSLANSAMWYGVAASLLLVAALRLRHHIGNRATIGAAFVSVLFPPWIIPGAGVVVLAIVRSVARARRRR